MRASVGSAMTANQNTSNSSDVSTRTLLISLWAFATLLWSIFTPPHQTFAARVLLCQPAWIWRATTKSSTWTQDLALFLILHSAYGYWTGTWRWDLGWLDLNDRTMQLHLQFFSLIGVCGSCAGGIVFRGHQLESRLSPNSDHEQHAEKRALSILIPRKVHSLLAELYFQLKSHMWHTPETTASDTGRLYTNDEELLEAHFHAFLMDAVSETSKPLRVVYEPAYESIEIVLYSPGFTYEEDHKRTLTMKVLSPDFYRRFVLYTHAATALDQEAQDGESQTVCVKRPELLPVLLDAIHEQRAAHKQFVAHSVFEKLRWAYLRRLRNPLVNETGSPGDRHSELDLFVRYNDDNGDAYRRTTTKLLLTSRLALVSPASLTVADWLFRTAVLLLSMLHSDNAKVVDVFRPRKLGMEDVSTVIVTLLLANAVHIWSFVKG